MQAFLPAVSQAFQPAWLDSFKRVVAPHSLYLTGNALIWISAPPPILTAPTTRLSGTEGKGVGATVPELRLFAVVALVVIPLPTELCASGNNCPLNAIACFRLRFVPVTRKEKLSC